MTVNKTTEPNRIRRERWWNGIMSRVGVDGTLLWEGTMTLGGKPAAFYRALELPSLYEYAKP